MRRRTATVLIALTLAAVSGAAAQVQPFVAGGISFPAGRLAEPEPAVPYGGVNPGLQLDGGIAIGFERGAFDLRVFGTYATMSRDYDRFNADMERNGIDLRLDGSARVIGGGVGLVYYLPYQLTTNVYPYVLATGGIYRQRLTEEWSGDDVVPGTPDEEVTDTRIGAGGGLGLVWDAGRLRLFVESRLQGLFTGGDPGYLVPVQFGLKFGPP